MSQIIDRSHFSLRKLIEQHLKSFSGFPIRSNCPVCYNKNTFSADIVEGSVVYFCYHASCHIKGRLNDRLSLDRCRELVKPITKDNTKFVIPDYWQNPLQNRRCLGFIQYWKMLDAYADKYVNLYYDPKQERCVFLIRGFRGELNGATGRSLNGQAPKWFVYHRTDRSLGLIRKKHISNKILLVEDLISAVRSPILTAALLGTYLPTNQILKLKEYSKVFIALDPDATIKSIDIQKAIQPYTNAYIIPLQKDIKYYNDDELENLKKEFDSYA